MRLSLAALGVVVWMATFPACAFDKSSQREDELIAMLEALTPVEAEAGPIAFGGCFESVEDPDCASRYLSRGHHSSDQRLPRLESLAISNGWAPVEEDKLTLATVITFVRDGFQLGVWVYSPDADEICAELSSSRRERSPNCQGDWVTIKALE